MKLRKIISLAVAGALILTSVKTELQASAAGAAIEKEADRTQASEESDFIIDENGVLTKYQGQGGDVIIPEGVTSIGDSAFAGCSGLTSISIPGSVARIGEYAFTDCSSLRSVSIPAGVTSIGDGAFQSCSSLVSISLPESVMSIGDWSFNDCSSLTSITVDKKNPKYDSRNHCNAVIEKETNTLLYGCSNTIIPKGVTSIGHGAFNGCSNLANISIPEGVTSIGNSAFEGCSGLISVSIPEGVTNIGNGAFNGCSNLANVSIPEGVASIGDYAFNGCSSLASISIPGSVTSIGSNVFEGCSGLTSVSIPGSATSIGWRAFSGCSSLAGINIPGSVTSIGGSAFSGCSGLTSISIPEGVTRIGGAVFADCSGLTKITVDEKNPNYDSRDHCNAIIETATNKLISGCRNTSIPKGVTSIGYEAFSGCSNLASISIPEGVTSIENSAFEGCSGLTSVSIPEGVTSIENSAFEGCSGLTSVSIPGSVTSIENSAFNGCRNLTDISIPEGVTSIGYSGVFWDCSSLASITVDEKNPKYDSRNHCNAIIETDTNTLLYGCSNTIIPGGVTSIGDYAFNGCRNLTDISIPEGVTSIGDGVFSGCSSLASISIPGSVTSIVVEVPFWGCSSLTSITVDEKNPKYDSRDHCNAIIETKTNTLIAGCSNTTIPESVTGIGYSAFAGCSGLTSIKIPESVTGIGAYAFQSCSSLASISIPESVTSIGGFAFLDCSSLASVSIPKSVTNIGEWAFFDCSSQLTLLVEKGSYAETYAKEYPLNYRTVYILDASEKTALSKDDMTALIEKNAENDVVITTDTGVTFTFAKSTMKVVDTAESYNFNTVISYDFAEAALPDSVKKEDFVAKVSYQYSGKLPAEAEIRIPVGKEYAGKSVLYSLIEEDGTLGEGQKAVVDVEGFLTVKQSYCSAYVVTLTGGMMGDADGNGNITAEDALAILKHVVGAEVLAGAALEGADVDANNQITAEDALAVLKKVVGAIGSFDEIIVTP